MTKLIVNADDFGLSEAVNYGIISAHRNGIVKSTTIMTGMPGFEHAVGLLKENLELGCGVHMTLTLYKPVIKTHKTIVDENGYFYRSVTNEFILEKFDLDEVYKEFCAQIDKAINSGIKVTHLDSHHHVHTLVSMKPVIERITSKYKLPIRGGFKQQIDYNKVVPVIDSFYNENVSENYFEKNIENIKKHSIVDIMSHPAFIDKKLVAFTSYSMKRLDEYEILTADRTKEILRKNNIEIINYGNI